MSESTNVQTPVKAVITDVEYPYTSTWDKNRDLVNFTIQGVHISVANSLRRAITSEVPTIGFRYDPHEHSTIKITKNTTNVNDQMISHQLSLIPIHVTHPDTFDVDDYEFIIDETNNTNVTKQITSEHIKIKRISTNSFLSDSELRQLIPPDVMTGDFIPIVTMLPKYRTMVHRSPDMERAVGEAIQVSIRDGVTLQLVAKCVRTTARGGNGKGQFAPACTCVYQYVVDSTVAKTGEDEYVETERQKAMSAGLTPIAEDKLRRRFNINLVQRYYMKDEYGDPSHFRFRVESIGVIPPLIIAERAAGALVAMVEQFVADLRAGANSSVEVKPITTRGSGGFNIKINNRDDTLGNLIMSWLSRNYSDYSLPPEERRLEFVGYHRSHPMQDHVNIEIRPLGSKNSDECIETVIIPGCINLIKHLMTITHAIKDLPEYVREAKQIA